MELLGSALFNPLVLEYAPKEKRFGDIVARLKKVPGFVVRLVQAQRRMVPPVWAQVAKEENDGNIELIDKTLREAAPASMKGAYDAAAGPALDALRSFDDFLVKELPRRRGRMGGPRAGFDAVSGGDWRLGAENYATKFRLALATDDAGSGAGCRGDAAERGAREDAGVVAAASCEVVRGAWGDTTRIQND